MRILVTAASKHGSTAGIAEAIAVGLRRRGHEVVVTSPDSVEEVYAFDAIVLGSAVYAGHWLKPALQLIERFADRLVERPVWLFSSGPIGDPPKPEEDPVDVRPVLGATHAKGHRIFAGRLDKSKLSFPERAMVTALHAPYGDFRDWDEIQAWTSEIADALVDQSAIASS